MQDAVNLVVVVERQHKVIKLIKRLQRLQRPAPTHIQPPEEYSSIVSEAMRLRRKRRKRRPGHSAAKPTVLPTAAVRGPR